MIKIMKNATEHGMYFEAHLLLALEQAGQAKHQSLKLASAARLTCEIGCNSTWVPHTAPLHAAQGPFVISGHHRVTICKEIIDGQLDPKPSFFRDFSMAVYCFSNPEHPDQVCVVVLFLYVVA